MIIDKRKRLKWNNKIWNVDVLTYPNKRMCLSLRNKNDTKEMTIDLNDVYLDKGHIFLDPNVKDNGILKVLKKSRIIKNITGMSYYDYVAVPIAIVNMGILRQYDYKGVIEHLDIVSKEG